MTAVTLRCTRRRIAGTASMFGIFASLALAVSTAHAQWLPDLIHNEKPDDAPGRVDKPSSPPGGPGGVAGNPTVGPQDR